MAVGVGISSAEVGGAINAQMGQREALAPKIVPKSSETPAEVMKREQTRLNEGKRGIAELGKEGGFFDKNNDKTPEQIIKDSFPHWTNNESAQNYVQEAQQLYRELETEKGKIREPLLEGHKEVNEAAIAAKAEEHVFNARVNAAMSPPEPTKSGDEGASDKPTEGRTADKQKKGPEVGGEKEPTQEGSDEKAEKDRAETQEIITAVKKWIAEGGKSEHARSILEIIATQRGATAAQNKLGELKKDYAAATNNTERSKVQSQYKEVEKVSKASESLIEKNQQNVERMKKSKNTMDRLFACDVDLAQMSSNLTQVDGIIQSYTEKINDPLTSVEEKASIGMQLKNAQAEKMSLEAKKEKVKDEKNTVGTKEQQSVDYVVAEVMTLSKGIPLAEGETQEQRDIAIAKDPLGFLQSKMGDTSVGITKIVEQSGLSKKEQQKLIDDANMETARKALKATEIQEKVGGVAGGGAIAFLLLFYAASKKDRGGGGMG